MAVVENAMTTDTGIVVAEAATIDKKFLGLIRRRRMPQPRDNAWLYGRVDRVDGFRELREIMPGMPAGNMEDCSWAMFYHVSKGSHPLCLEFVELTDAHGDHLDCRMDGHLSVCAPHQLLQHYAMNVASPEAALSEDIVASWVVNRVAAYVCDSVKGYSWDDLRNGNSLPAPWWEKQFSTWLQECGVELHVGKVSWPNPNKEAAQAAAARRDI